MNFIKDSVEEIRKVTWPTRNQAVTLSVIVIIFTVIATFLFLGSDRLFRAGYDAMLESSAKVQNQEAIQVDSTNNSHSGGATTETLNIETEGGDLEINDITDSAE